MTSVFLCFYSVLVGRVRLRTRQKLDYLIGYILEYWDGFSSNPLHKTVLLVGRVRLRTRQKQIFLTSVVSVYTYTVFMSKLQRYFASGQSCFITAVTANRQPILDKYSELFIRAVQRAKRKSRFAVVAWVILPDHFHVVIDCPDGDVPAIVQRVKLSFSLQYQRFTGEEGSVWQHRYWDHIIRSDGDMKRHVDYIHYNPVKHALTESSKEWPLSSFHRYLQTGHYDIDWGEKRIGLGGKEFGE